MQHEMGQPHPTNMTKAGRMKPGVLLTPCPASHRWHQLGTYTHAFLGCWDPVDNRGKQRYDGVPKVERDTRILASGELCSKAIRSHFLRVGAGEVDITHRRRTDTHLKLGHGGATGLCSFPR